MEKRSEANRSDRKWKFSIPDSTGAALFLLTAVFLICSMTLCTGKDIWYDELFTMEFSERPVAQLISLTAQDVHPPLYYILVRAALLTGKAFVPAANPIVIAKLTSVLPFWLILLYSLMLLRRNFGWLTAGLFSFCVVTMPQMADYTVEVRMYSWALFFVTAAALHAYEIMKDSISGYGRWDVKNGILMLLFGIAACYTHYYACIAVGVLYLLLMIWMITQVILSGRMQSGENSCMDYRGLGTVVICMNVTVLAFLPWIRAVAMQVHSVKASYWIQPLTWRSIGGCIRFLFKPAFTDDYLSTFMAVLLFGIFAVFLIAAFMHLKSSQEREKKLKLQFALFCMGIMLGLVAAGFIASALIRPVFVYRYMLPACGAFWLSFAILAGLLQQDTGMQKQKKIQVLYMAAVVIFVLTGIRDFHAFRGNELYKKVQMENTQEQLSKLPKDTKIVCNFGHVQALVSYARGNEETVYLYGSEPEAMICKVMTGLDTISDASQIRKWLEEGDQVIFLGSFNSRQDILNQWKEENDIVAEDEGSCMYERYWFDIFSLKLAE
ncbi:MAG: hypothetical protein LKF52_10735 [Butyrivibrio sp.]|jgi:hypothetical protein|nr:hypothetical protein [Butyrivibrio sp.]